MSETAEDLSIPPEELERAVAAADEEERRLRMLLGKQAAHNARLSRALRKIKAPTDDPSPLDLTPLLAAAAKATGMTHDEILAAAADWQPEPLPMPPDPRVAARRRAAAAGVPELHIQHLVDQSAEEGDALAAVRHFLDAPELGFLVLSGGKGTHKTGSACWFLSQVEGGRYVEADDLFAIALEDKARHLRIRSARAVVLDDLGTEIADDKGYWLRTFNRHWDSWYAACAKVIVTCNIPPETTLQSPGVLGFRQRYGERAYDRLRERGRWVDIGGESKRGAPRSE